MRVIEMVFCRAVVFKDRFEIRAVTRIKGIEVWTMSIRRTHDQGGRVLLHSDVRSARAL